MTAASVIEVTPTLRQWSEMALAPDAITSGGAKGSEPPTAKLAVSSMQPLGRPSASRWNRPPTGSSTSSVMPANSSIRSLAYERCPEMCRMKIGCSVLAAFKSWRVRCLSSAMSESS